jgi:hypothetical protein
MVSFACKIINFSCLLLSLLFPLCENVPKFTLTHLQDLYRTHISNRECILLLDYISSTAWRKIVKVEKQWFHMALCPFVSRPAITAFSTHVSFCRTEVAISQLYIWEVPCTNVYIFRYCWTIQYNNKIIMANVYSYINIRQFFQKGLYSFGKQRNEYEKCTLSSGMWDLKSNSAMTINNEVHLQKS